MDVLEQVRDIGRDDVPVSEWQIDEARRMLVREIARAEAAPTRRRRSGLGATVGVAGLTAAAVAITVLAPARVDPAAAAVLERAADVTITANDTTLAPGQYLRIQTDSQSLMKWDVDMGDTAEGRFNNGNRRDAEAGLVVEGSRVLYVPADRSGDWVWDWTGDDRIVASYGDRSAEAAADWNISAADSGYWPDVQLLPGGEVPAAEGDSHEYLLDSYRRFYDEMPRRPQALLEWFRERSGDPDVSDQWVVQALTEVLSANLMPADLRAAMLRALALVPGIQVMHVDGDRTTLEHRSGDWLSTRTTRVTLDTSLGMITAVAETDTYAFGGPGVIPESVPDYRTTITTTVVDTAPTR